MAPATMTAPTETPATTTAAADSQRLFEHLSGPGGAAHDAAVAELHALLLRAARFEIERRRASLPHLRGNDHEDLAQQSADDALVETGLSARQREVLVAVALNDVLSCEECFAQLDRYVELSLAGTPADREVPGMRAHLEGCPACAEDFHSLRDFVEGEG
jgi:hypothetical protein